MLLIQKNVSLGKMSCFGVGGKVKYFALVKNLIEVKEAYEWAGAKKKRVIVVGGCYNLVIKDGTLDALVIKISGGAIKITGNDVSVDAGVTLLSLVQKVTNRGLSGMETLAGIPGTLGGAIVGNAGAYGQTISDHLVSVLVTDGKKELLLPREQCHFAYRESIFKKKGKLMIISANFYFLITKKEDTVSKMKEILLIRKKKFGNINRCPGSFFKNFPKALLSTKVLAMLPQGKIVNDKVPTALFIEAIGGKGMSVGDAAVCETHANIILNNGRAKFKDVRKLARIIKRKVKAKFGINIEEEVRYIF